MKDHGSKLLQALNAASAALQRSAHSQSEVLTAFRNELARLGLRGGLSLLDKTGKRLIIRTTVQPAWMVEAITGLEKLTGYKAQDYSFSFDSVTVYRQAIQTRQAVFVTDSSKTIQELLPNPVRSLAGLVLQVLDTLPGIYAPLNSRDRAIGVLNVVGNELTQDDIPAIEAFANHIAIALENADLFAALLESEQRFRTLSEASFEGIALSQSGVLIDFNDQLTRMLGYEREELIGQPILQCVAPESREAVFQAVRSEQLEPYEHVALRKDGSRFPVEIRARTANIGDRELRISAIRDITERKHAEDQVRDALNYANTFIASSPVGIVTFKATGEVVSANETLLKMIGTTLDVVLSQNFHQLKSWKDAGILAAAEKAFASGQEQILETYVLSSFGKGFWCSCHLVPFQYEGESRLLAVMNDITERKQAEAEREALIADLEVKNAELERFAYTVSHDLKSPLITIRGFMGYIEQDAQSGNTDRLKADIQRIKDATDKMQRLLNELLELSRIGRLMNEPEAIPFADLVHEVMDNVRGQLETAMVTVILQPNLPTVYGDRQRLMEVLQNLIDNAAKFMGDQTDPRIEIGQHGEKDGKPVFYVKDNGIGIAPEHHERVFGLFNQLDPKMDGTGVGLALVKRIIEFHGGRIWVESEPGKGAIFFFTLSKTQMTEVVK